MRVSIERGYHAPIQELMGRLQTSDPKLAVHHIIGCWFASNGCPGHAVTSATPSNQQSLQISDDEFIDLDLIEF